MKTRSWYAAVTLIGVIVSLAATADVHGQELTPLPLQHGDIAFALRATKVNDFVGHVSELRAEFKGGELRSVRGLLELRVEDMHTGIGLRDSHMRRAMRADRFPTIRFELAGVELGASRGDTIQVIFMGHLTIRGASKTIRVPGSVVLRRGAVDVTASTPIDMRDYDIEPPSRFLGAVRVEPVTTVTATLHFGGK